MTMNLGEKCELKIQSAYGYGVSGSGEMIPPGANLIFICELMKIDGEGGPIYTDEEHYEKAL